ncbi:histone deacetylase 14 [Tanacetum coccineum]
MAEVVGNLKFILKGEDDEVFGMQIPNELITNNIRNAPYYNAYLEMVAKHDQKTVAAEGGKKKSATKVDKSKKPAIAKQLKPKPAKEKSSKPTPAPKPKVTKEKPSQPSPLKNVHKGKVLKKVRKEKGPLKLVDKEEEVQHEHVPEFQGEGEDDDYQRAIQMSLESFQAQSQAPIKGVAIREPVPETTRKLPEVEGKGADTDKTNSGGDTEIMQIGEEQGDDVANMVNLEEKTTKIDEGQAGSDPGKTPESRPPPDDDKIDEDQAGPDPRESSVALVGPNLEPTHDKFMANVYPNVHESLKFLADEHVILEDPLSSSGILSSMKNLDDAYTIGD